MTRYFALVPAAGSGSRMGEGLQKQYRTLAGRPLIRHALDALCAAPGIAGVYVVLSPGDLEWARHDWSALALRLHPLYCGGSSRAASVLNGLRAMARAADDGDWVLVHDAARPCLATWHVDKLIREVGSDPVGGILAVPVADTLKRDDGHGRIAATAPRDGIWQAQTPQMFRYALLRRALEHAGEVTDEAGAIERAGLRPRLVAADATNLKVTYPVDMGLAELILRMREEA
ncbi:MAG: 2-C-methyl-D-erythritol 4-phosphate cytidylyltransferase [Betaproteobacteria bacterium]|nr:2-C-methyl-D-erythritol 4-phosphate cytidylyltransferase [Betaproteobacteria bacterium]